MILRKKVLDKVDNPQSRTRIAAELGTGEQAVATQMRLNRDNGRLTKMDALQAISKESGIEVEGLLCHPSEAAADVEQN